MSVWMTSSESNVPPVLMSFALMLPTTGAPIRVAFANLLSKVFDGDALFKVSSTSYEWSPERTKAPSPSAPSSSSAANGLRLVALKNVPAPNPEMGTPLNESTNLRGSNAIMASHLQNNRQRIDRPDTTRQGDGRREPRVESSRLVRRALRRGGPCGQDDALDRVA